MSGLLLSDAFAFLSVKFNRLEIMLSPWLWHTTQKNLCVSTGLVHSEASESECLELVDGVDEHKLQGHTHPCDNVENLSADC